jgi:hypothetical protein
MPTILFIDGIQYVIYFNDHSPAHAHAIGPGWTVKLGLEPPEVLDVEGASRAQTRAALKTVRTHQALLLQAWKNRHG